MKITAVVENKSTSALKAKHGLSLYIETANHKILFDTGPDDNILPENSEALGIDLSQIDTVIISHGHKDHGGGLRRFLELNQNAKVFVQKSAFGKHYSKVLFNRLNIGIDPRLQEHRQVVLLNGDYQIDDELFLFTVPHARKCRSSANDNLYDDGGKDNFLHEQNLMIFGSINVLVMGCGHTGAVNILEKAAAYNPHACVGGYHLWNPVKKKTVPEKLLDNIAQELARYDISYFTCHCTGEKAYEYFSKSLHNMNYLSCGETIRF